MPESDAAVGAIEQFAAATAGAIPISRIATPDDIVGLVFFLACQARYITGAGLALDHGMTAEVTE